jgi:hypothetical protein
MDHPMLHRMKASCCVWVPRHHHDAPAPNSQRSQFETQKCTHIGVMSNLCVNDMFLKEGVSFTGAQVHHIVIHKHASPC